MLKEKFESIIAETHFKHHKYDMLDVIIASMLSNEPVDEWDIDCRLVEDGIPGFERKEIKERLKMYSELYEAIPVRNGYIKMSESYAFIDQMSFTFKQCRRPPKKYLNRDIKPRLHTYKEDGIDTERNHRTPVPVGAQVFTRIYTTISKKYHTEFFSHIYAFKLNDGPLIPIDMWFFGTHS